MREVDASEWINWVLCHRDATYDIDRQGIRIVRSADCSTGEIKIIAEVRAANGGPRYFVSKMDTGEWCHRCEERRLNGGDEGGDRCAFKEGVFTDDNRNCSTLNGLILLARRYGSVLPGRASRLSTVTILDHSGDETDAHIVLMHPDAGDFVEVATVVTDEGPRPLCVGDAESVLLHYPDIELNIPFD